jgi:hypothetical protein
MPPLTGIAYLIYNPPYLVYTFFSFYSLQQVSPLEHGGFSHRSALPQQVVPGAAAPIFIA